MKRLLRIGANVLMLLGLVVGAGGMLTAQVLVQGERELRSAEALAATGKLEDAIVHARASASWFAPGAPHVAAAYAKLISIARLAEGRGDKKTALFAWRAVRSAAISTRWVLVPHEDKLTVANASIARIAAQHPPRPGARLRDPAEIQQKLHVLLERRDRPRLPWVAALLAGFAALTAGFIHMGWSAFTSNNKLQPSRLRLGAIVAAIGAVAWALALWNA